MPLSGLTVIEIGQNIAGPFAGTILADLGADVIKIEKPGGDDARFWLVEKDGERHPLAFHILNRNKRSAVVDFKDEAALARFLALVERADVLVHNLRPGLAETLGIGQAALEARNPRLVYCEVGAFGRTGPLASKPGYEPLAHAYAGIMAMNGPVEGLPMRAGASIVDPGTGMWAVIGILAALRRRSAPARAAGSMSPCSRPASAGSISRSRTTCSRSQKHPVPSQLIGGNWLGDSPQVVNRLLFKDRTLCGRSGICVLLMAAATMLSGCGLIEVERVEQAAAEAAGRIGKYAPRGPEEPRFGKLVVTEQRWLGISVTEPPGTDLLPADLLEEGAVVLPLVGPQEDGILAARIEDVSGLSVARRTMAQSSSRIRRTE